MAGKLECHGFLIGQRSICGTETIDVVSESPVKVNTEETLLAGIRENEEIQHDDITKLQSNGGWHILRGCFKSSRTP